VEEHRLPVNREQDATSSTGYMHQAYVVRMAQSVGFKLDASSEINANPKDTADHPGGVWALPPTYTNKDVDRASYQAIGESDRMTLRFVKPVAAAAQAPNGSQAPSKPIFDFKQPAVPTYPPESIRAQEQGRVVLRVLVDAEGIPRSLEIARSSGYASLDKSALAAVRKWRFIPAKSDGAPVEAWVDVPVNFSLKEFVPATP
jgi:TonB family protein